jgi:hypothetical protein
MVRAKSQQRKLKMGRHEQVAQGYKAEAAAKERIKELVA